MERIGTPAKWLQALGWLLWTQPVAPSSAGCSYAGEVALDIEREALALQHEFTALAANDWSGAEPKTVAAGISALVNPWLGSMERLRWAQMEKPMRAASAKGPPDWRHMASGQTAQSWAA